MYNIHQFQWFNWCENLVSSIKLSHIKSVIGCPMWKITYHKGFKPDVKCHWHTTSPLLTSVGTQCEKSISTDVKCHFCSRKDSEKENHLLCLSTNHCNLRQGQQKNLVEMEEVIADVVVEANLVDNKVDCILLPSNIFALTKIFPTNLRMLKLTSGNFLSLSDVLYRAGLK